MAAVFSPLLFPPFFFSPSWKRSTSVAIRKKGSIPRHVITVVPTCLPPPFPLPPPPCLVNAAKLPYCRSVREAGRVCWLSLSPPPFLFPLSPPPLRHSSTQPGACAFCARHLRQPSLDLSLFLLPFPPPLSPPFFSSFSDCRAQTRRGAGRTAAWGGLWQSIPDYRGAWLFLFLSFFFFSFPFFPSFKRPHYQEVGDRIPVASRCRCTTGFFPFPFSPPPLGGHFRRMRSNGVHIFTIWTGRFDPTYAALSSFLSLFPPSTKI